MWQESYPSHPPGMGVSERGPPQRFTVDMQRYMYGEGGGGVGPMPPEISPLPAHLRHDQGYSVEQRGHMSSSGMRTPGSGNGSVSHPAHQHGPPHHSSPRDFLPHEGMHSGPPQQPNGAMYAMMPPEYGFSPHGGVAIGGGDAPYGHQQPPAIDAQGRTGAEFLLPRWSFNDASASATALIHPAITGWLIGPKGAAIGRLKESTGCRMWVNTARQTLSIRGDNLAELYAAVRAVESHVKSSPVYVDNDVGALPGEAVREATVACAPELLDEMQCHVRSIKRQSGAHTTFVNRKLAAIVITGPAPSVTAAVHHVHQVLARAKMQREEAGTNVGSAFDTMSNSDSELGGDAAAAAAVAAAAAAGGGMAQPHHWTMNDPSGSQSRAILATGQRPLRSPAGTGPAGGSAPPGVESWQRQSAPPGWDQTNGGSAAANGVNGAASRGGMGGGTARSMGGGAAGSNDGGAVDGSARELAALDEASRMLPKPPLMREHSCATRLLIAAGNDSERPESAGAVTGGGRRRDGASSSRALQNDAGLGGTARSAGDVRAWNAATRGRDADAGPPGGAGGSERRSRSSPPALAEWDFSIDVADAMGNSMSLSASPVQFSSALDGDGRGGAGGTGEGDGSARGGGANSNGSDVSSNRVRRAGPGGPASSGFSSPNSGTRSPVEAAAAANNLPPPAAGPAAAQRWDGARARALSLLDGEADDGASDVSLAAAAAGEDGDDAGNAPSRRGARAVGGGFGGAASGEVGSPLGSTGSRASAAGSGASGAGSGSGLAPGFHAETLEELLSALGLEKWETVLAEAEVDLAALRLMTDGDLAELGLPKGPRVKLVHAQRRGEI